MQYRYKPTKKFWEQFQALPDRQQKLAREKFRIFAKNPFDARLRTHKIHRLSAIWRQTVHAVVIEGDLRAAFYIEGNTVVSVAIGTHDIYKS
jgi:mRNA-degrading endonuclease RelE of RelBE toxin-antitoxin system